MTDDKYINFIKTEAIHTLMVIAVMFCGVVIAISVLLFEVFIINVPKVDPWATVAVGFVYLVWIIASVILWKYELKPLESVLVEKWVGV